MENKKETKIEAAIKDTKLRLEYVEKEIMLMMREKATVQRQLEALETINNDDKYL